MSYSSIFDRFDFFLNISRTAKKAGNFSWFSRAEIFQDIYFRNRSNYMIQIIWFSYVVPLSLYLTSLIIYWQTLSWVKRDEFYVGLQKNWSHANRSRMEIIIADNATPYIWNNLWLCTMRPNLDTSYQYLAANPPAGCSKSPTSHQRALKKRGHVGDLRRRVPHIKSLRRPVTDERAPSPVHFVIHIS